MIQFNQNRIKSMTQGQLIRWGMIGVGSVAEHKSGPAFMQAAGGALVAVASRTQSAAEAFAVRHSIAHVFNTPKELIHSDLVDAVYIATPPASHLELALEVARARKPCVIEKPITVYLSEALELCSTFDAIEVPLFVSYYRRTLLYFSAVKDAIDEKAIGEILSIEWALTRVKSSQSNTNNWRLSPLEAPGGLFEDLACHGLDLFDYYFGPITKIDKSKVHFPTGDGVPNCVEAWWDHGATVKGHGIWNFDASTNQDQVTISGTQGTISFAIFDEKPIIISRGSDTQTFNIPNPVPIQLPHVIALNQALHGEAVHPSSGHSAARTSWVSEEILRGPSAEVQHLP
jgi:1,5-anhydro-D-fructose reductase (1,5-anhydro-D-mannitol-forming)